MGFATENQVRTGLPAGGKEIRTLDPPEAIYTELVFKTLFTRWKTRNTDPFRGAASAVDCRGTGGYQRPAAASSQGMTVTSGQIACALDRDDGFGLNSPARLLPERDPTVRNPLAPSQNLPYDAARGFTDWCRRTAEAMAKTRPP